MLYAEIVRAYEARLLDAIEALELSGCFDLFELYENAATWQEKYERAKVMARNLIAAEQEDALLRILH